MADMKLRAQSADACCGLHFEACGSTVCLSAPRQRGCEAQARDAWR
jgi:hypothetical protein